MITFKNHLLAGALISFLAGGLEARAVNPALPSIPKQAFNVTRFGAIGDGVKDNTTNIQSALNAASAAGVGAMAWRAG